MEISKYVFPTYDEANDFARTLAKKQGGGVALARCDEGFVVTAAKATNAVDAGNLTLSAENGMNTSCANRLSSTKSTSDTPSQDVPGARICIDCGCCILERMKIVPSAARCIKCQTAHEASHGIDPPRFNEAFGTREDHKRMRGQDWSDMRKRGR